MLCVCMSIVTTYLGTVENPLAKGIPPVTSGDIIRETDGLTDDELLE